MFINYVFGEGKPKNVTTKTYLLDTDDLPNNEGYGLVRKLE